MVGDHHDVGLIENAIGSVCVENFCNEGIGYGFEVGEFHRQRIGGEMRVQIDSREVDNLNFRDAVILYGIEQLGH